MGDESVVVDGVWAVRTLEGVEFVFGKGPNGFDFSMGEAVHGAARVLPGSGGHKLAVPGAGQLLNIRVIPVFASPASRVVRYFADRHCFVSIFSEPFRHGGRRGFVGLLQIIRSLEERLVVVGSELTGEQGIARGAASGGVDVVSVEGSAGSGESIYIGGLNVVDAERSQFRAKVVYADEEYVRAFFPICLNE